MAFSEVVSLEDVTALAFEPRRPGYARATLREDGGMRASVLRVEPGGCVPAHKHTNAHDLFIGISGELEIRWDSSCALLRPGCVCSVPPNVRHEVHNRSERQDAYCVLVHAGAGPFDFVGVQ